MVTYKEFVQTFDKDRERKREREREQERFFKSFLNELVFFIFYVSNIYQYHKIWSINDFEYGSMKSDH